MSKETPLPAEAAIRLMKKLRVSPIKTAPDAEVKIETKQKVAFCDRAMVMVFESTNKDVLPVLSTFQMSEDQPKIDDLLEKNPDYQKVSVPMEYLKIALRYIEEFDDAVAIYAKKDMPIFLETKRGDRFVIAPRVED